jgi:hypothetical protein
MTVLNAEEKENSQDVVATLVVARFLQGLDEGRNVVATLVVARFPPFNSR